MVFLGLVTLLTCISQQPLSRNVEIILHISPIHSMFMSMLRVILFIVGGKQFFHCVTGWCQVWVKIMRIARYQGYHMICSSRLEGMGAEISSHRDVYS
ncbi:hypothetical protein NL676_021089 [Syzygium grande]|nr:hypothetical protein NL676_021089 [Syzygium grande]